MSEGTLLVSEPLPGVDSAFGADDLGAGLLREFGFVSEEFLVEGDSAAGKFCTRILVRRPRDVDRCTVMVVEPQHFGGGRSVWNHLYLHLLRSQYAWAEVACQTGPATSKLAAFSEARYSAIHLPGRIGHLDSGSDGFSSLREASDAFSAEWWDSSPALFTILNAAVRGLRDGSIGSLRPQTVVLAGASQSAGVVRRYGRMSAEGELTNAVDGLLPLHSGGEALPADLSIPTLELLAEADLEQVRAAAGLPGQGRGFDHRGSASPSYACLEVPGMSHNDSRYRRPHGAAPAGSSWSRFPHSHVLHAALESLLAWVRTGRRPANKYIQTDREGRIEHDEMGHPRGGLRTPAVDMPLARLETISPGAQWTRGHEYRMNADESRRRFATARDYVERATLALEELVSQGLYLREDARAWLVEESVRLDGQLGSNFVGA